MIDIYVKNVDGVWFGVAYEKENIHATTFTFSEKDAVESLKGSVPFKTELQRCEKPSAFAERMIALIKDVYDGKGTASKLSLSMKHLSNLNRKVLDVTAMIPVGYVSSYGMIAKVAGTAPRAVGRMMARNPFAPIVPCHRVVGSDFSLVGYGGGLNLKLAFLKREKRDYASKREIPMNGKKLMVFPVEFVLKKTEKK
jgi:methylated-DNA-[protein]-cysteine S-methyltransferase